jgi:hypothetical protein
MALLLAQSARRACATQRLPLTHRRCLACFTADVPHVLYG